MFRGTTPRTVVSTLDAALLSLQFFTLGAPFAQAHTPSDAQARAKPGFIRAAGQVFRR